MKSKFYKTLSFSFWGRLTVLECSTWFVQASASIWKFLKDLWLTLHGMNWPFSKSWDVKLFTFFFLCLCFLEWWWWWWWWWRWWWWWWCLRCFSLYFLWRLVLISLFSFTSSCSLNFIRQLVFLLERFLCRFWSLTASVWFEREHALFSILK